MGAPDNADEGDDKIKTAAKEEATKKLLALNQTIAGALADLTENNEQRLAVMVGFTAGLAKGLGKTKEETLKMVDDLFDAATALDDKAAEQVQ